MNGIVKDDEDEEMMTEKVIDCLPFHVAKNAKEILF